MKTATKFNLKNIFNPHFRRIFRIGLDNFISSVVPVLVWFLFSVFVNSEIAKMAAIFLPMTYLFVVVTTIFGNGANISAHKNNQNESDIENELNSANVIGVFLIILVAIIIIVVSPNILNFVHKDIEILRQFFIFATLIYAAYGVMNLILQKFWYEKNSRYANKLILIFNLILIISTIIGIAIYSFIFKNILIITTTLAIPNIVYVAFLLFKNISLPKKWVIKLVEWFKFDLVDVVQSSFFFVIYLFGFANVFHFGSVWSSLIALDALCTSSQWSAGSAVNSVSSIDTTNDKFNYKQMKTDSLVFITISALSMVTMTLIFFSFYHVNLYLALFFISFDIFCIFPNAIYSIKASYLQVKFGSEALGANKLFANIIRTAFSFVPTPLCTQLGETISIIYQYISVGYIYKKKIKTPQ